MLFILANGAVKSDVVEISLQDTSEEPDMCVGCGDEKEVLVTPPELTIEIQVDPITGEIQYIIKGITLEQ